MPLIAVCLAAFSMTPPDPPHGQLRGALVQLRPEAAHARPVDAVVCDTDLRVCAGFPYRAPRRSPRSQRTYRLELEFDVRDAARERREFETWPVGWPKRTGWLAVNYSMCGNYDHGPEAMAAAAPDLRLGRPTWGIPTLWSVVFTDCDPPIPSTADLE